MNKTVYKIILILLFSILFTGLITCTQSFNIEETLDGPEGKILTINPGEAQVSVNDTLDFSADGGVPGYKYSLIPGNGIIDTDTGLYTAPGIECSEIISVEDSYGSIASASVEVIIGAGTPVLIISPSSITVYKGTTANITATGGTPPYTFSLTGGIGGITAGGLYTAPNTTGTASIRVTDSAVPVPSTDDGTVTVTDIVTNVDYEVTSAANTGGTVGGNSLEAEFLVTNTGSSDGSEEITWTAYISTDTSAGAGDEIADTGTIPAINSTDDSGLITVSGTCPEVAGNYYIIIVISSQDDLNQTNNSRASAQISVSDPPIADIDYFVNSISAANTPAAKGSAINETFTYRNSGDDNGSRNIQWTAYYSLDEDIDGSDKVVKTGTASFLSGNTTSAPVTVNGTWPDSSGVYYLIISLYALDDINPLNNSDSSPQFVLTSPAVIDYMVSDITDINPVVTTDMPVSEYFDITNTGGLAGSDVIKWTAYASLNDTELDTDTDEEIGSGETVFLGLPPGGNYSNILIDGFWPSIPGTYYLFVDISSLDETVTENNSSYSGPFTVKTPPDYSILSAVTQNHGTAGEALEWDLDTLSNTLDYSFIIRNNTSGDGLQSILWKIYCSFDNVYDQDDVLIKTGTASAVAGSSDSVSQLFEDADWPDFGGYYYLIINLSAPDDISSFNNTFITAAAAEVPETYTEGSENNDDLGPAPADFTNLDAVLTGSNISAYELVKVRGTTDVAGSYDTYKVTLGPDATKLDIYAEWTTGTNEVNMTLWDDSGIIGNMNSPDTETEPAVIPETFEGLTPEAAYYVGVRSNQGIGNSYSLYIFARP